MIEADAIALEQMIDKHGLTELVDTMARICAEKADHIRASYQDENLARIWDKRAARLTKASQVI